MSVRQHMALTAFDVLCTIVAARTRTLCAFDTLAIKTTGGGMLVGMLVTTALLPLECSQQMVDTFPVAALIPALEMIVDKLPFRACNKTDVVGLEHETTTGQRRVVGHR